MIFLNVNHNFPVENVYDNYLLYINILTVFNVVEQLNKMLENYL